MNKTLLVAGLGAIAYYMYKKMSPQDKERLTGKIKDAGRKLTEQLPEELKNAFGQKNQPA